MFTKYPVLLCRPFTALHPHMLYKNPSVPLKWHPLKLWHSFTLDFKFRVHVADAKCQMHFRNLTINVFFCLPSFPLGECRSFCPLGLEQILTVSLSIMVFFLCFTLYLPLISRSYIDHIVWRPTNAFRCFCDSHLEEKTSLLSFANLNGHFHTVLCNAIWNTVKLIWHTTGVAQTRLPAE
jgi:hypothetical protein